MAIPDEDDEKTRIIRRPASGRPPEPPEDDDSHTTPRAAQGRTPPPPAEEDDDMTRLAIPRRRPNTESAQPEAGTPAQAAEPDDPVVGWLVVLAGPGRGQACRLGYGQNSIGRERGERVCLDFGDATLSRQKHCFIIYEPRKREYILRPGDGANLTYLNGDLVSEPRPLKAADLIELGQTTLRFVPFCGPEFDWQDQPPPAAKP